MQSLSSWNSFSKSAPLSLPTAIPLALYTVATTSICLAPVILRVFIKSCYQEKHNGERLLQGFSEKMEKSAHKACGIASQIMRITFSRIKSIRPTRTLNIRVGKRLSCNSHTFIARIACDGKKSGHNTVLTQDF